MRIIPAAPSDVPAIFEMIRALAEYEKLTHLVTATEEKIRESLFGPKPAAEVLLAEWNAELAGFALFFPNYSTFLGQAGLYLEDLYVKPHARGNGLGIALLKELARIAVARGYGRVEWAVLDWNEPSIQFYKKLGAVPMDDWTVYRLTGDPLRNLADSSIATSAP